MALPGFVRRCFSLIANTLSSQQVRITQPAVSKSDLFGGDEPRRAGLHNNVLIVLGCSCYGWEKLLYLIRNVYVVFTVPGGFLVDISRRIIDA
jgi:hypothetical protein